MIDISPCVQMLSGINLGIPQGNYSGSKFKGSQFRVKTIQIILKFLIYRYQFTVIYVENL